jgi:hypothetical protein
MTGTTWGRKGTTPTVKSTGGRFRFNLISAINSLGQMRFMLTDKNVNNEVYAEFLRRLLVGVKQPIALQKLPGIIKSLIHPRRHADFRAPLVRAAFQHRLRLVQHQLPPRSPTPLPRCDRGSRKRHPLREGPGK